MCVFSNQLIPRCTVFTILIRLSQKFLVFLSNGLICRIYENLDDHSLIMKFLCTSYCRWSVRSRLKEHSNYLHWDNPISSVSISLKFDLSLFRSNMYISSILLRIYIPYRESGYHSKISCLLWFIRCFGWRFSLMSWLIFDLYLILISP